MGIFKDEINPVGHNRKEFPNELKMHDIIMMCEKVTF